MKVKLFTHTDLDGVGCAILAKWFFEDVDIDFCEYSNINQKVADYVRNKDFAKYAQTFITDISLNEETADLVSDFIHHDDITLFDHHKSAEWMVFKYSWAFVQEYASEGQNCGTSYFLRYLRDLDADKKLESDIIKQFAEMVRRYDTWEWKTRYHDPEPNDWNQLFHIIGRDEFIEKMLHRFTYCKSLFMDQVDQLLVEYRKKEINRYINEKAAEIIPLSWNSFKVGVVFADRFVSELGSNLSISHPEYDFFEIINPARSISFRTAKDIDLSEVAKMFGGGGHPKAAGAPITPEQREIAATTILNLAQASQGGKEKSDG